MGLGRRGLGLHLRAPRERGASEPIHGVLILFFGILPRETTNLLMTTLCGDLGPEQLTIACADRQG